MNRVFVDTSAWFSFINKDDPQHERVTQYLKDFTGVLITSNFIFDEIVTLVLIRSDHKKAVKIGSVLKDPTIVRLITLSLEDEELAWDYFKQADDKTFSFTDCTSFILMKRLHITTALSLDSHFDQAGFSRVP